MPELQISMLVIHLSCSLPPVCFTLIQPHLLWMSQCVSWTQELGGSRDRALSQCGGGRAETTERRWSLKVRFERDAAEQAVALCYTAGSVATEGSPAFSAFHRSRCSPQMSAFSASLSVFVSFYIQPYCPSLSLVKNISCSSAWHCFSIRYKASSWVGLGAAL